MLQRDSREGRLVRAGRRRLSLLLLLIGIGLTITVLFQAQRAFIAHRDSSTRLIRDYGAFAAWSFRQHASELLRNLVRQELTPAVHATGGDSVAGRLSVDRWRAALAANTARAPFHFRAEIATNGARASFAGQPVGNALRTAILGAVRSHARSGSRPTGDFAVVNVPSPNGPRLVAYALVGGDPDTQIAYGFEVDSARLQSVFESIFASAELLPRTIRGNRTNSQLVGVSVAPRGRLPLYRSSGETTWTDASTEVLTDQLGELSVEAAILADAVAPLTGEALTRVRLQLLGGLTVLACCLVVVAVYQLRRESELSHLRSDFVSSVSHELRTPLAQIQLFLETLTLGRHRTAEQRAWILDSMQREVTRLTALVDNVLHFSRAERGLRGGQPVPMVLAPYLKNIVRDFAPIATARDVQIVIRCPADLRACVHPESFRQVILNLLDNALKYGPKGQTVTITGMLNERGVGICVDDEGSGVDPKERRQIFAPFRRGANALGTVAVGSGIGLAVAQDVVSWHDGTIHVEGAPGGGARFVIELPPATGEPATNVDEQHDQETVTS